MATHPGGFVFGTADSWSLLRYDARGAVLDTLALNESRLAVTRSDIDAYVESVDDPAWPPRRLREYPFPSRFPAYAKALVSEDGFTWVEQYLPPYPKRASRWKVFAPDGAFAAVADLPAGFELMWVGETRVAGVASDELDVQTVEVRPLLR